MYRLDNKGADLDMWVHLSVPISLMFRLSKTATNIPSTAGDGRWVKQSGNILDKAELLAERLVEMLFPKLADVLIELGTIRGGETSFATKLVDLLCGQLTALHCKAPFTNVSFTHRILWNLPALLSSVIYMVLCFFRNLTQLLWNIFKSLHRPATLTGSASNQ